MDLVADCVINGPDNVLGNPPEESVLGANDNHEPLDRQILVAARDWLVQIVATDGDDMPFRIAVMLLGDALVHGQSVFTLIDLVNAACARHCA
jgi:hypothetical protein